MRISYSLFSFFLYWIFPCPMDGKLFIFFFNSQIHLSCFFSWIFLQTSLLLYSLLSWWRVFWQKMWNRQAKVHMEKISKEWENNFEEPFHKSKHPPQNNNNNIKLKCNFILTFFNSFMLQMLRGWSSPEFCSLFRKFS